jgi:hypothetical protein
MTRSRTTAGQTANSTALTGGAITRSQARHLSRLLRCLLNGRKQKPAEVPADPDSLLLQADTGPHVVHRNVLRQALSLGLVEQDAGGISARPEAISFLRREKLMALPGVAASDTAFAEQHREIVAESVPVDAQRQPVRRNLADQPLASLARLKDRAGNPFLPTDAVEAGDRLARDFDRGQLQPRITARWEPQLEIRGKGERGGMADLTDMAVAARHRVGAAADAMGPELAGVALDVCCFGKGLELVERERGWPARSAKLMLRTALMALARHYAPPAPQRRSSHHWGTSDYRPDL